MLVTVGNVAAVLGNFIFSALLEVECLIGFMGIGCLLFGKLTKKSKAMYIES